ncbi:hypothetical protein L249_4419 [Ophiocordyceps polyrhachis-furcata BCC 54312]|uniref:Uncharacterized protein n=1 Tax=Ophiocordyceps polyrhachis-furcata BCC 54312 TaxID=1330021 RepID=A0A367L7L6_9HYPO|nr:hypothetical protein L249_4419 [Ophiocordyceps polyrhachis-furcata BCC 54312]
MAALARPRWLSIPQVPCTVCSDEGCGRSALAADTSQVPGTCEPPAPPCIYVQVPSAWRSQIVFALFKLATDSCHPSP